jgi:hypothetical protein
MLRRYTPYGGAKSCSFPSSFQANLATRRKSLSVNQQVSTTNENAIDLPAMRLVNVTTKKSCPIQRIEVFTKTVGVELPSKT